MFTIAIKFNHRAVFTVYCGIWYFIDFSFLFSWIDISKKPDFKSSACNLNVLFYGALVLHFCWIMTWIGNCLGRQFHKARQGKFVFMIYLYFPFRQLRWPQFRNGRNLKSFVVIKMKRHMGRCQPRIVYIESSLYNFRFYNSLKKCYLVDGQLALWPTNRHCLTR